MPYYYKKKLNKRLRNRRKQRNKKLFNAVGHTNKLYRNRIPRMLQIATRRNPNQMLRFVTNQTYLLAPTTSGGVGKPICLSIRANSLYDIMQNSGVASEVISQSPTAYGPGVSGVHADGWTEWKDRYQHFTVLGAKLSVTCQPYGTGEDQSEPGLLFVNLAGIGNKVNNTTTAAQLNVLPYTKKGQLYANSTGNTGSRCYMFYSAKKFEGVVDVADNSNLRGSFDNTFHPSGGSTPAEQSFFNIWVGNVNPAATKAVSKCVLRLKVEWIAKLTEPTDTNQVQQPAGMQVSHL